MAKLTAPAEPAPKTVTNAVELCDYIVNLHLLYGIVPLVYQYGEAKEQGAAAEAILRERNRAFKALVAALSKE